MLDQNEVKIPATPEPGVIQPVQLAPIAILNRGKSTGGPFVIVGFDTTPVIEALSDERVMAAPCK